MTAATLLPACPCPVEVISFGYGHAPAPAAHLTVDVRAHFRDPHVDPALRQLTAADAPVNEAVMSTPGVTALIGGIVAAVAAFRSGPVTAPLTVAIGCAGGRHRSAVIAAEAARRLGAVTLTHRDIGRPVITRRPAGKPGTCPADGRTHQMTPPEVTA